MDPIPAILGGSPVFDRRVNIVRPALPRFEYLCEGIQRVLESRMVTKGKYLAAFEQAVSEALKVKHAVAVSSCTSGLMLTYRSLGLEGEVVVPSFTFMATVGAMVWAGLKPIFADVNRETTNLDPASAEAAITPRTSAIVAVHNFGNPAEIDELQDIADRHGIKLVFDAAHGFGARYRGHPIGPQGNANIFSMSPTKLLITGEGGLVATEDDTLAENIRIGREYGNSGSYNSAYAGLNARLPEINALMGIHSLAALEEAARSRNETVNLYHRELGCLPGVGFQSVHTDDRNSYKDFSITIDPQAFGVERDELHAALTAENIDTRMYYDPPVHRQTAYMKYYDGNPLPNTEWLASHSLSLPVWSFMEREFSMGICHAIQRIHENAGKVHGKLELVKE